MAWIKQYVYVASPNYPSNYPDNFNQQYSLKFPGAKHVRIYFGDFYTELNYDKVYINQPNVDNFVDENGDNFVDENNNEFASNDGSLSPVQILQVLQGNLGPTTSVTVTGDTIIWVFNTDGSVNFRGWRVDYIEGEYEVDAPSIDLELKFDRPLPSDLPPDVYPQNFGIELSTRSELV